MKNSAWIFFLLSPLISLAQYGKDFNLMNNRVIVNHTESTVYAFVLRDKPEMRTDDDYLYYWFASNDIKHTRGAYEGKLLHGQYTEFYLNKNLKEKGKVKYGLKRGTWKSWYPNGEYKEIVNYKNSEPTHYTSYYENGNLKSKGKYKNSKLQGIVRNYTLEGQREKIKYKRGVVVTKAEKIRKPWFHKNSKDSITVQDTASSRKHRFLQKKKKITVAPFPNANQNHGTAKNSYYQGNNDDYKQR